MVTGLSNEEHAALADGFAGLPPAPPAAAEAARLAFRALPRLRGMLDRAESACFSGREVEACSELEDLRRLLNEVLGPEAPR